MTPLTKALKGIYKQIRRYNNAQVQNKPAPNHERHGTTSDWVGVIVNAILALFTLYAIWLAYQANETSSLALKYTKEKDSIYSAYEKEKNRIESIEKRIKDEYEKKQDSLSNNRADSSLDAQIGAIRTAQNQFEAINQPFLQIYDVEMPTVKAGSVMEIMFKIQNVTDIPVKVYSEQFYAYFTNSENPTINEMRKNTIPVKRLYYITKEQPYISKSTIKDKIDENIERCIEEKRNCRIFIYKSIRYKNLVTGKYRRYESFIKISRVNQNPIFPDGTYSEFIYNENFDN